MVYDISLHVCYKKCVGEKTKNIEIWKLWLLSQAIYYKNTGKLLQKYRWVILQIIVKFALVAAMSSVHAYTMTKNNRN